MENKVDTKKLTFTIIMGALGSALFLVSYSIGQIVPGIIALDLSLLAVFIAGIYAGPKAGFITGLIAGIIPGIMFGPLGTGGALGLIALPLGKSFTGLTIGLLATIIHHKDNKVHKAIIGIPLIFSAYIPEGIFTYTYFTALLPLFLNSAPLASAIVYTIMTKAIIEVAIMSIIIAVLLYSKAVNNFIGAYFHKTNSTKNQTIKQ
jgi:thiamine transporter ThiT